MANTILTVQSPVAGINRRTAYQTQAPFSSYDSNNFWPIDVKTGRISSATRPPLKLFGSLITEANMVSTVAGIRASHPAKSFCVAHAGSLYYWNGSAMTLATGAQAASINTGKYVSATPIVSNLVICDDTNAPIAFNYTTGAAATIVASAGTVPVATTIAVTWQGALWLVKDSIIYSSRVGDITDWDTTVALDDLFAAFFTDGTYAGVIAGPITAVMPQTADVMLVSTVGGTLAMRGHPRQGGVFEPVSSQFVLGQGAWTQLPDGTILMMTAMGLMSLAPTRGAVMSPISRERIPDELIGLSYDRDDPLINVEYDTRFNVVHIYVRGAQEQAWLFDLNTGGFHREEISSYPFSTDEYESFITESVSGCLLARYNGVFQYDRFATETISSSLIAGPVKISQSPMHASKILNVRTVFARDTPSSALVGTLKIAGGLDGQDAVNRLLNGNEQYSISLAALGNNNGMCYPDVVGHAVVFALTTESGDVAIEEIVANVSQMGNLTMQRGTQIGVDGEATTFSGGFTDIDLTVWNGYSVVTPSAGPSSTLVDFTHFMDLSRMPASWWSAVTGTVGEDIRVTTSADVEIPSSLTGFSLANQTGMLVLKLSQSTTPSAVRVWCGNPAAITPLVAASNGQYACFDDNWRGFWPDGGGTSDMTQYDNNTATSNKANNVGAALSYGTETGPLGGKATDFDQGANTWWYIDDWAATHSLTTNETWTFIGAFLRNSGTNIGAILRLSRNTGFAWQQLQASVNGTNSRSSATSDDGTAEIASSDDGTTAIGNWHHHTMTTASDNERSAYIDGGGANSQTNDFGTTVDNLQVGSDFNGAELSGDAALIQVHNVTRNAAWVAYQASMMDQSTFWGTPGAFVSVNPPIVETPLVSACPSGYVSQTEAGSTDGYALITASNPVGGAVINFSHLIDLAQLPSGWWTQASASGKLGLDIRATLVDNTIIPFDLIEFDATGSTGLGVIRLTQSSEGATAIRLWVGNSSAITIDSCNVNGRFGAYDSLWRGFWPSGGGTDRTQYANDMTSTGSPSVTELASPVGSQATTYDNASGLNQYATATNLVPSENPITIMASVKKPSGGLNTDSMIVSVQDSDSQAGVFLRTRPSSTPARTTTRNSAGTEASAGYSGTIVPTVQWFQAGTSFGNHTRISYADANAGSSSSSTPTIVVSSLDRITIAAEWATTPTREIDAIISLVGIHASARGETWLNYWNASLAQSSFWTVGAWVSDPTALS